MKRTTCGSWNKLAAVAVAMVTLAAVPADAKQRTHAKANPTLCEVDLANGKTTDLFLRRNNQGRRFLYIASVNGTLAIYDVSKSAEPREVNTLAFSSDQSVFQVRSVDSHAVVASGAPDFSQTLTVLDLANTPSVEIEEKLKNVDAYTIDAETNTLYVARSGKLSVMQFDHPLTRESEIWEQFYEGR